MRQLAQYFALAGVLIMMAFDTQASPEAQGYVTPEAEYFRVGPAAQMELEEALASDRWQPLEGKSPNFGYISDTVWLRFAVPDLPGERTLLEIRYPQLDDITFYLLENGQVIEQVVTGDRYPFEQRPIAHRHFLFPFNTHPGDHYEIVLSVETQGAMQIPMRFWTPGTFFEKVSVEDQLHSVYYGILLSVIFFNLFVFLALRERMYLMVRAAIALNIGALVISFVTSYSIASQLTVALAIPSCLLLTIIGPVQWLPGSIRSGNRRFRHGKRKSPPWRRDGMPNSG